MNLLGPDAKKRNTMNIVDRPFPDRRAKAEVSLSAMIFLFSELIQYTHRRVSTIKDLERRLQDIGYEVGVRLVEYFHWKEKAVKRETRLVRFLSFISTTVWKSLFGKIATLEKSVEKKEQYMITEDSTLLNEFISLSKDMQGLNTHALVAGIIEGLLDSADFPARVSAHSIEVEDAEEPKSVFLMEFSADVLERERRLGA